MSRLKRTLVLWVLGYFEPGRTTAAAHGMCEPFGFHRGVGTPLVPGFPHRYGTRCRRTLFGVFRLFGIHIPLKPMDICGRKVPYVPGVGAQIAGAVPAVHVTYSGALPPITSNGYRRRYVKLGLSGAERFCLPPKVGPYSVRALDQVCARDAQATSDLGVIPAVY